MGNYDELSCDKEEFFGKLKKKAMVYDKRNQHLKDTNIRQEVTGYLCVIRKDSSFYFFYHKANTSISTYALEGYIENKEKNNYVLVYDIKKKGYWFEIACAIILSIIALVCEVLVIKCILCMLVIVFIFLYFNFNKSSKVKAQQLLDEIINDCNKTDINE